LNRRQYTNAPIIAAVYFLLVLFPCFLWSHVGRFVILGVRPDFFTLSVGIAVLIAPYLIMALFLALLIRIPNKRRSLNWFDKGVLLAGILAALFMARMGWVFVDSTQEIYVYASARGSYPQFGSVWLGSTAAGFVILTIGYMLEVRRAMRSNGSPQYQ
jgi:hypothetical protein